MINHSLLLAKLKAYGFSDQTLSSWQSYLCSRFQRSIINRSFSRWNEVITGVPQGSILGSPIFNIFLNDIFLFISKCQLCNYADNNTLYKSGKNMPKKIKTFWKWILQKWLHEIHMALNPVKCHCIATKYFWKTMKLVVPAKKSFKVFLGSKLKFDCHVNISL